MWSCPNCEKHNDTDAVYCSNCGADRFNAKYRDYLLDVGIIHRDQGRSSQYKHNDQIVAKQQEAKKQGKTCRHCGCRLPADAMFCRNCGERVAKRNNYS